MKFAVVFAALFAVAACAVLPGSPESLATVEVQQADISPDQRSYSYALRTSNGISETASGQLVEPRAADQSPAYNVQGEFSWVSPEGQQFTVRYTADADGFHPVADHLPVAPVA